jgi:hypothetical protein
MIVQTSRVSFLFQNKENGNVNLCPKMSAFFSACLKDYIKNGYFICVVFYL